MPYAIDNKISKAFIEGGIEITDAEYKQALEAQLSGQKVAIRSGALRILSTEKKTVWSTADKSEKEIPVNEDVPEGYTGLKPGDLTKWAKNTWVEDTAAKAAKEAEEQGRIAEGQAEIQKTQKIEQAKADLLEAKGLKTPTMESLAKRVAAIETILGV
jgi:hypothetical protein